MNIVTFASLIGELFALSFFIFQNLSIGFPASNWRLFWKLTSFWV